MQRWFSSPPRRALSSALVAVALLGGCDGENLFVDGGDPAATDDVPPTVAIVAPDSGLGFPAGQALPVDILLQDDESGIVRAIVLGEAFRGDSAQATDEWVTRYQLDEVVFSAPVDSTVLERDLAPTDDDTAENVYIKAVAFDAAGNADSASVVILVGGPAVSLVSPADDVITDGQQVLIRVSSIDPTGLDSLRVAVGGAVDTTFSWSFAPPIGTEVTRDTTLDISLGLATDAADTLTFQAFGWNTADIRGASELREVTVVGPTADETAPEVALDAPDSVRAELDDGIVLTVRAQDEVAGSGLRRVGLAAYATWIPADPAQQTFYSDTISVGEVTYGTPRASGVETFTLRLDSLGFPTGEVRYPAEVLLSLTAFAEDDSINCGAGTSAGFEQRGCDPVTTAQGVTVTLAADGSTRRVDVTPVMGRTVRLPDGGIIADAAVDTMRDRLYLANILRNRVDVIETDSIGLVDPTTLNPGFIPVGSKPWGLFINGARDSLLVANSGGKNISFVNLDEQQEKDRLFIPEQVLWQISFSLDEFGNRNYGVPSFFGFSDRPQFIAQDSAGQIVFSTKPTPAAPDGTIRVVRNFPAGPEPQILLIGQFVVSAEQTYAIANLDSIGVVGVTDGDDIVTLYDHIPGDPDQLVTATSTSVTDAAADLVGTGATDSSDVEVYTGTWDLEETTLSDTTFVSASGNRGWIAFGEGATASTGRVLLWHAEDGTISNAISVVDLIDNASERVLGLGLNMGGGLEGDELVGVARGREEVYFFDQELALLGVFSEDIVPGGAGAALHPEHDERYSPASASETVSFIASGDRTIKTVNTVHFNDDGLPEMPILNEIVGPMRAAPVQPDAPVNVAAGLTCPGADPATDPCVVVRLFGVVDTNGDGAADGVVVVNVRRRDLAVN